MSNINNLFPQTYSLYEKETHLTIDDDILTKAKNQQIILSSFLEICLSDYLYYKENGYRRIQPILQKKKFRQSYYLLFLY